LGIWPVGFDEHLFCAITLFLNVFIFIFLLNRYLISWRHSNVLAEFNKISKRGTLSSIQVFTDRPPK
jgi:hypothetical protein